ncbi:MAG: serine/threonine-protein phosphatase PGAM5 [Candidatus Krumholzibacteriia bacterium]|jgi:serine/threonine-protein phosphatase PGAM5
MVLLAVLITSDARATIPTHDEPTRTVYLVRHGWYDSDNDEDPDVGKALITLGRQQARLIADRLDAMDITFDSIQASAMTRARQTGEIIAPRFPYLELDIRRDIRECIMVTRRQDIMETLEEGEAEECETRLQAAWGRLFVPVTGTEDEHDIIVCHGNVIRWFVTQALEVDLDAWLGMSVSNASLTTIQVRSDGSFKVLGVGDSGHIPYHMNTLSSEGAKQ